MHTAILLSLLGFTSETVAWGGLGHRTVGYLAQNYFNDNAVAYFEKVINPSNIFDISDAAIWADGVRYKRPYTSGWHFIDAKDKPPQDCNLKFSRDCKKDAGCVISALSNQTSLITSPDSTTTTINEALKFIIHFIGDMHQPLHTEDLDRGGNGIPVSFDGHHAKNINLHEVWDTAILRKLNDLSQSANAKDEKEAAATWSDKLADAVGTQPDLSDECTELADPDKCGILWATETNKLVCSYVLAPGVDWIEQNDLGGDYYTGAVPVVEQQITKAGLRLAAWVNAIADNAVQAENLVKQDL